MQGIADCILIAWCEESAWVDLRSSSPMLIWRPGSLLPGRSWWGALPCREGAATLPLRLCRFRLTKSRCPLPRRGARTAKAPVLCKGRGLARTPLSGMSKAPGITGDKWRPGDRLIDERWTNTFCDQVCSLPVRLAAQAEYRSEAGRVGKEGFSPCRL